MEKPKLQPAAPEQTTPKMAPDVAEQTTPKTAPDVVEQATPKTEQTPELKKPLLPQGKQ